VTPGRKEVYRRSSWGLLTLEEEEKVTMEEAQARRKRLRALRSEAEEAGAAATATAAETDGVLKFRNYVPQSKKIKEGEKMEKVNGVGGERS